MLGARLAVMGGAPPTPGPPNMQLQGRTKARAGCLGGAQGVSGPSSGEVSVSAMASALVALAEEAGDIIRKVAADGELGTVDKKLAPEAVRSAMGDLQTEADRRAEARIVSVLRREFPGVLVIAEEETEAAFAGRDDQSPLVRSDRAERAQTLDWDTDVVEASRVVVYVDPLDGTNEFASGHFELVTTLLGLAVDGVPVAGIIGQPFYGLERASPSSAAESAALSAAPGRVVFGGPGAGVHGLDAVDADTASLKPLVVGLNRGVRDPRIEPAMEQVEAAVRAQGWPGVELSRGSASGWHCLQLLERRHGLYLHLREGTKKWDTAPGEALLVGAMGGRLTDVAGRSYVYDGMAEKHKNLAGLIASLSVETHEMAVSAVSDVVAPFVSELNDPSVR